MELAPALPVVLADRVQLQQVIINLVINGIEAMQSVTDRPRELTIRTHQDEARQVVVTLKDCGIGISAADADRLFNAFCTTKSSVARNPNDDPMVAMLVTSVMFGYGAGIVARLGARPGRAPGRLSGL